ncbi:MAG: 4-(cytidine 5'-diphospho)-2-C-methyl-D-erythritol kinase, partial [Lautropia sp.]
MTLPAPAKLNLFLHVTGRREDGLHLLETVFQFIDLQDDITLAVAPTGTISRTHDPEGVSEADDLTLRAARALKAATGSPLGARITLTKHIPMGAGLGGGSSDAATVLLGLNELWQTGLSRNQLIDIARPLGADVPIFVHGQNAYATGI